MSLYVNYGSGQTNMNTSAPHMKVASKYKTYFHSKHFRFSSVVSWAHMDYKTILLWQSNKLQLLFVWLQVIVHLFSSSILILDKKRKRFIFFLQTSIVFFFFFVQWFSCHPRLYPILNLMTSVFYILCLLKLFSCLGDPNGSYGLLLWWRVAWTQWCNYQLRCLGSWPEAHPTGNSNIPAISRDPCSYYTL